MIDYPIFRNKWLALGLLLPTLLILLVFLYYPLWQMFVTSFYRSNFVLNTRTFNGVANFVRLFSGPFAAAYRQVFVQTLILVVTVEVIGIGLSMILAYMLTLPIRGLRLYQGVILLTFALSPSVMAVIFSFMFNPEAGIVNHILGQWFGIKPDWLGNGVLAMGLTATGLIWKNLGYNVVFYIAAFRNLPKEIDAAAKIDGAHGLGKLLRISAPLLSPTTFFLVFTNLTFVVFDSFGFIDIFTRGSPVGRGFFDNTGMTSTLMYKIFLDGFGGSSNIGTAAAQSILLFILVVGLAVVNYRVTHKNIQYGENN
ncbi:sugar ABC transporter permease [Candidatus Haliotispira prima]|uniref:sn-glycerol-3-phosphate transport system permease protein UgpA n=1 Tax=Candidatus Haliotispira prima TaxID=3034016 RepID=A0ABY8MN80_9SPIO|nr:sugar ABC transporter permease [Candidatus Haliotispira prima]